MRVLSRVQVFVTPWTVAHQAPLSVGFPRQEYWSGLLFPSPGDLSNPGMEPVSLASPELDREDPGGGHGNPVQYPCLENPTDRGAWRATVHGVTESQTRLSE